MITDGTGNWHYLAIKSISGLLGGITSTHNGVLYCFHSYRTLNKLKNHEELCKKHDYCNLELPNEENKYLSSTSGKKSLKAPFIIYADLECFLVKMNSNENTRIEEIHIPSGYSILTCYSFDKSLNELKYYRGKDCMEHISRTLKSIFMKLINYEQKAMIPLTDNEKILHANQIVCFLCGEEFCNDKSNTKEYKKRCKVRDHCHFIGRYCVAAHDVCNSCYKVSKTIPVVFHKGSMYDHHFIIKQLAKDFNGYFNCIGENTEKYMRFSITIIKESDKVSKRKNPMHIL